MALIEVAAIARGADKAELAKKLGVHHYIDSATADPATALQALGGAQVILVTAPSSKTVSETFKGLRPGGVSVVVGVAPEPIESAVWTSSLEAASLRVRSPELPRPVMPPSASAA